MTEVPSWVVIAAGIFFVVNILFFLGLIAAGFFVIRFLNGLTPKISALEKSVQGLIEKVQGVATRVEEVATHVRETVDNVGGKAKGVVGSAELVAQSASRQFEKFSPFAVGALTAIRIVRALNEARKGRSLSKATSRRGTGQSKRSGGHALPFLKRAEAKVKRKKNPILSLLGH